MNKLIFILLLTISFSSAFASSKFDSSAVIRIDIGNNPSENESRISKRDLEKRLYRLEKAVRQLQERVFDLEIENSNLKKDKEDETHEFTCYIKTPFDGTFTSTKRTETAAKAEAMRKCSEKAKSVYCNDYDAKCSNQ